MLLPKRPCVRERGADQRPLARKHRIEPLTLLLAERLADVDRDARFGEKREAPNGPTRRLRLVLSDSAADGRIARAQNYLDIDEARAGAERLAEERG